MGRTRTAGLHASISLGQLNSFLDHVRLVGQEGVGNAYKTRIQSIRLGSIPKLTVRVGGGLTCLSTMLLMM